MYFRSIVLFLIFSGSVYSANRIEGRVVSVHDGDTLTLLVTGNQTMKIRLAQIDAPESDQAFGQKSKQSLSGMVFNRNLVIEQEDVDRYGRIVGTVFIGDLNVNRKQIEQGMAWVFRKYAHDATLFQLEANAKQTKVGLWVDTNPVPPWEYRHGGAKPTATTGQPSFTGTCGSKRYCKQMISCEEANQYLGCGISSLDKDGDGVPCESLCKN